MSLTPPELTHTSPREDLRNFISLQALKALQAGDSVQKGLLKLLLLCLSNMLKSKIM